MRPQLFLGSASTSCVAATISLLPLNSRLVCKVQTVVSTWVCLAIGTVTGWEVTDVPKSRAVLFPGNSDMWARGNRNTGVLEREPASKWTSQDAALWLPRPPPTPYRHEGELLRAFQPKRENKRILEISRGKHSQSLEFPCISLAVPRRGWVARVK